MADQRAEGKKLIGAQASAELWAGVDEWLVRNPGKTVTDFVLAASLEKLERSGIDVDQADVLRDRRGRRPQSKSSSKIAAVEDGYFSGAGKKISYRRPQRVKKSAAHPGPVPVGQPKS